MRLNEFNNTKRDFAPTKSNALTAQGKAAVMKSKIDPNNKMVDTMVITNKAMKDRVTQLDKSATNISKSAGVNPNTVNNAIANTPPAGSNPNKFKQFSKTESSMKGGTDFDKFMDRTGNKEVDDAIRTLNKDNSPSSSGSKRIKKRGYYDIDGKDYYYEEITLDEDEDFEENFGILGYSIDENDMFEAEYQGRTVKLNKPMRGDVKKFKVYVKNKKGNVIKVNFGHGGTSAKRKTMRIRKSNPKARKSFRARHNCDNPGPKWKARYWSCKKW